MTAPRASTVPGFGAGRPMSPQAAYARAGRQWPMFASVNSAPAPVSAELGLFLARLLARCLDVRSLWSLDDGPGETTPAQPPYQFLVFADARTLHELQLARELHRPDIDLLVVTDGDAFETAWGPRRLSGSLARWAWRRASAEEAYYDESRWERGAEATGGVVRQRRRAVRVWESSPER